MATDPLRLDSPPSSEEPFRQMHQYAPVSAISRSDFPPIDFPPIVNLCPPMPPGRFYHPIPLELPDLPLYEHVSVDPRILFPPIPGEDYQTDKKGPSGELRRIRERARREGRLRLSQGDFERTAIAILPDGTIYKEITVYGPRLSPSTAVSRAVQTENEGAAGDAGPKEDAGSRQGGMKRTPEADENGIEEERSNGKDSDRTLCRKD